VVRTTCRTVLLGGNGRTTWEKFADPAGLPLPVLSRYHGCVIVSSAAGVACVGVPTGRTNASGNGSVAPATGDGGGDSHAALIIAVCVLAALVAGVALGFAVITLRRGQQRDHFARGHALTAALVGSRDPSDADDNDDDDDDDDHDKSDSTSSVRLYTVNGPCAELGGQSASHAQSAGQVTSDSGSSDADDLVVVPQRARGISRPTARLATGVSAILEDGGAPDPEYDDDGEDAHDAAAAAHPTPSLIIDGTIEPPHDLHFAAVPTVADVPLLTAVGRWMPLTVAAAPAAPTEDAAEDTADDTAGDTADDSYDYDRDDDEGAMWTALQQR
jgi:hypothetical protein